MSLNVYTGIEENRTRLIVLLVLFFVLLSAIILLSLSLVHVYEYNMTVHVSMPLGDSVINFLKTSGPLVLAGVFALGAAWVWISYSMGSNMILSSVGAMKIYPGKDYGYRELIRLVENVSITAGIRCPQIYLIHDESANAFATGTDANNSAITFTTGILKRLNKQEIEAVTAHEIAHIIHRDVRTMVVMISCIGFLTFAGEFLIRTRFGGSSRNNSGVYALFLGLALLLFGYLFAPLFRLAVSRQQEYHADARAALLTRNPLALATALEKISQDSRVEVLDSKKLVSSICIANPLEKQPGFFEWVSGLGKTHPPITARVARLKSMGR